MRIELLNVEASSSVMVAQRCSWSSFELLVIAGSSSALGVQVLTKVSLGTLDGVDDVADGLSTVGADRAISLVEVVDVVLVVEGLLAVIFEDLC